MRNAQQYSTTKNTNENPADFIDPILIDSILDKKSDPEDQYSDSNFVRQVFSNKFFEVRISFEEARLFRFGNLWK